LALPNCYTAQVGLLQTTNPPTPCNNPDKQGPQLYCTKTLKSCRMKENEKYTSMYTHTYMIG